LMRAYRRTTARSANVNAFESRTQVQPKACSAAKKSFEVGVSRGEAQVVGGSERSAQGPTRTQRTMRGCLAGVRPGSFRSSASPPAIRRFAASLRLPVYRQFFYATHYPLRLHASVGGVARWRQCPVLSVIPSSDAAARYAQVNQLPLR